MSVLLTAAVITVFGLPGHSVTRSQLLVNLTMLQTFVGVANIDGVYWTMAIELAFYGWVMLALRLGLTRRIEATLLGWIAIPALGVVLLGILGIERSWAIATALLLYYGHLFMAGMLFYRLRVQPSRPALWLLATTFLIETLMRPESALIVGLWYVLFILLLTGRLGLLNRRPVLALGAISYPLYLLHENIGFVIIRQLYAWDLDHTLLLILVPLAISVLLATAVHYAVEIPAQRAIRGRFRRRAGAEAGPPASGPSARPSAVAVEPAYNAGHIADSDRPSEEVRPWRQMRPASPVPVTTSRT